MIGALLCKVVRVHGRRAGLMHAVEVLLMGENGCRENGCLIQLDET